MKTTAVQRLHQTLNPAELRAVLFAIQMEARRYKDVPQEDLPLEIVTLLREKERLANIVHGLTSGLDSELFLPAWEIFLSAMKLELARYEPLMDLEQPMYVQDLRSALIRVRGAVAEARK